MPLTAHAVTGGKVSSPLLADEREAVQKKTFTKWVNSHLARVSCRITDLYTDLRDGRMLIKLLEVLSGEMLVKPLSVPWSLSLGPVAGAPLQEICGPGLTALMQGVHVAD